MTDWPYAVPACLRKWERPSIAAAGATLPLLNASFRRTLCAEDKSESTVRSYTEVDEPVLTAEQLATCSAASCTSPGELHERVGGPFRYRR